MKHLVLALLLALSALTAACGHVDMAVTDQTRIYRDAPIQRTPLLVAVQPRERTYAPVKALFYPLWVSQQTIDQKVIGRSLGRVMVQTWNSQRLFPVLVYDEELVFRTAEKAVAQGRARGADVVVTGVVSYYYDGGNLDDSGISIRLNIYETATGQLIFSMDQAAHIESHLVEDWILWSTRTRLPPSPMQAMVASIAQDMAVPLASWLPPPDSVFAETSADIVRGLTERTPAPNQAPFPAAAKEQDLAAEPGTAKAMQQAMATPDGAAGPGVNLMIHFDVDKAVIRPESYPLLDELGKALTNPPLKGRKFLIAGHTDSDAGADYNMKLGQARADAVRAYLTKKFQIPASLVATQSFGKTRPIAPNDTPAGKQRNRRVEVRLAS
ncbi:MAG TPA: flagellar motor protein MotB [Desulfovibrio sp.]|jgi:OOP family OmpA-OmpF porin|nr:flagellar motor protein MotB [Desulfovibrio sp.]HBR06134.1 flagellar motor protein MotB [Desulfovibrio sp.]